MSSTLLSSYKKLWLRWKSLRFPWRKRFLAGLDLHGNTYWEFRDSLNSHQHRMRRIIKYKMSAHHSDIQISPQWHQWLRHTRADPPSLTELSQDILRQEKLRALAAAVDAKWESESKLLVKPGRRQDQLSISTEERDCNAHSVPSPSDTTCTSRENSSSYVKLNGLKLSSHSGFSKHEADPGTSSSLKGSDLITETLSSEGPWTKIHDRFSSCDEWQPKSWDPTPANSTPKSSIDSHELINDTK
ncbi:NADH-ubiquinone oxidoreductase [Erysiphe necator]|uniref:Uncharacterized protein n=1 Tax=Uncinula necator TaxID=52586 RepID=A0A0B1NWZ0_UNCNE|nr:NADH-ubiquinone oxidoreductase [Erysiphe necator]KHJ30867.1 hypothetical protein EV44_g1936 [Erysiphe necator]